MQYDRPLDITGVVRVLFTDDLQHGTSDPDPAEDEEIDPAQLFVKAMTKNNKECHQSRGYVDDQLGDGDMLDCNDSHSVFDEGSKTDI